MWRLKFWLSHLGAWLWLRFGEEKTHIVFRHTCGSEVVQLADFRGFGPEFQCFNCDALVPTKDIDFRVLSAEEVEKIRTREAHRENIFKHQPDLYLRTAKLPHIVAL